MSVLQTAFLQNSGQNSVIGAHSILSPGHSKPQTSMVSVLVLTSLIDCFTILVIYLLMSASIGLETLEMPKDMQLPVASKSDILEKAIVLMVHNDQYFIDNQPIAMDHLGERLKALKATAGDQAAVIIQADRHTNFMKLNPIVLSGLQAGFAQIRFAVKQEDSP